MGGWAWPVGFSECGGRVSMGGRLGGDDRDVGGGARGPKKKGEG
jgi:hypothetical protein